MKRYFLIFIVIAMLFSSCTARNTTTKDIINQLCSAEAGLPSGAVYFSGSDPGKAEFLRKEMLATTFGIPLDFDGIESSAIWLSGFRHPCEFAVFLCKDANSAEDVALFCNQRIKFLLQNAYSSASLCGMSVYDYKAYISGAIVTISGRYVALIISSDPERARKEFIKAV